MSVKLASRPSKGHNSGEDTANGDVLDHGAQVDETP